MVVSSIAKWDWPVHWPQLIELLIGLLKDGDKNSIHGALQCLEMLVSGDSFMEEHIPLLYDHMFPTLLDLFQNKSTTYEIRFGAIKILNSIINWLSSLKYYSESSNYVIKSTISSWFNLIVDELNETDTFSPINQCILEILHTCIDTFPKYFEDAVRVIFPSLWKSFITCALSWEKYFEESVDNQKEIELIIISIIDLLDIIVDKKLSLDVFDNECLSSIFFYATKLLQLSPSQVEDYYHDHDNFLLSEDSDGFSFSVRLSSIRLIESIVKTFFPDCLALLQKAVGTALEEFSQNNSWRLLEALIFCVGKTIEYWTNLLEDSFTEISASMYFDIYGFIGILTECTSIDSDIVRGRIFYTISKLIPLVKDYSNFPTEFLSLCSETIQIDSPLITKLFACKCFISHLKCIKDNDFNVITLSIFPHLFNQIQYLKEESLCEFILIMGELIELSPHIFLENQTKFTDFLWFTWVNNNSDPILSSVIVDCIKTLSNIEGNQVLSYFAPKLYNHILEHMSLGIKGNMTTLPYLVKILCACIINAKNPIPEIVINKLYPTLIEIILTTDDHEVILYGCKCIIAYMRSCKEYLWNSNEGIYLILKVIEKCLDKNLDDDAAIHIGPLISKFISTFNEKLGDHIVVSIIQSVLSKLKSSKSKRLHQILSLILINLMIHDTDKTLDILKEYGLSNFLSKWTVFHEELYDIYTIKLSIVALTKIFEKETLNDIYVPSDIRIYKESEPQQHKANIPLRLRIFIIIVRDHMLEINKALGADSHSDSEDDEILNDTFDDNEPLFQESGDYFDQLVQYSYDSEYMEDIDPDVKNDEIYNLDIENYLRNWIMNFRYSNEELFNYFYTLLSPIEQEHVSKIVNI